MKKIASIVISLALVLCSFSAALAGDFNAGLTVSPVQDDSFTVTVDEESNDLLAEKKPVLTVGCPEDWEAAEVKIGGEDVGNVAVDAEAHTVSFTVEKGGTYVIMKVESEPEPAEPVMYTVTFLSEDGTTISSIQYEEGTSAAAIELPQEPVKDADESYTYSFKGWVPEIADVTADAEYKAEFTAVPVQSGDPDEPGNTDEPGNNDDPVTPSDPVPSDTDDDDEPAGQTRETEVGSAEETTGAAIAEPVELPFEDVAGDAWYREDVETVYALGLIEGSSEDHYSPEAKLSRGQMLTMLWRLAGKPETEAEAEFSDVAEGSYYSDAIGWAAEAGIADGTGNGNFKPEQDITREQLLTMLYRYAKQNGMAEEPAPELTFSDADKVSGYAADALRWAANAGILQGFGDNTIRPQNLVSRAQAAAFFARFAKLAEGK